MVPANSLGFPCCVVSVLWPACVRFQRALKPEFLFSRCGVALADATVLDLRRQNLGIAVFPCLLYARPCFFWRTLGLLFASIHVWL